jgi:hypothetical protein
LGPSLPEREERRQGRQAPPHARVGVFLWFARKFLQQDIGFLLGCAVTLVHTKDRGGGEVPNTGDRGLAMCVDSRVPLPR